MARRRILILSPEPMRRARTGVAIRLTEMARHLHATHDVTLAAPSVEPGLDVGVRVVPHSPPAIATLLSEADIVVSHGHVSNELLDAGPRVPLVFDLYDPFIVDNLAYADTLGPEVFRFDRATLERQLRHGDFFLVASEVQRAWYLGMLTILGRVNPRSYARGRDLRHIVDVVPFGVPEGPVPARTGAFRERLGVGPAKLLFFGGVYDWYDPLVAIDALGLLRERAVDARLLFVKNPNQEITPQAMLGKAVEHARAKGIGDRVVVSDWIPFDERGQAMADADVGVVTHRAGLETELSIRTRVLDFMWAGLPVVATEGGSGGEIVARAGGGTLVPQDRPDLLADALARYLTDDAARAATASSGRAFVLSQMTWPKVLAPLVAWLREPAPDATKPSVDAPPAPSLWDRLRGRRF